MADPETATAACAAAPCLSAVYLGTLYWFFYGAAFVIGILEIIAGVSRWQLLCYSIAESCFDFEHNILKTFLVLVF